MNNGKIDPKNIDLDKFTDPDTSDEALTRVLALASEYEHNADLQGFETYRLMMHAVARRIREAVAVPTNSTEDDTNA